MKRRGKELLVRVSLAHTVSKSAVNGALIRLAAQLVEEGLPEHGGYQLKSATGRVIGTCDVVEPEPPAPPRQLPPRARPAWHGEVCASFSPERATRAVLAPLRGGGAGAQ